jgi:hypothetical protein
MQSSCLICKRQKAVKRRLKHKSKSDNGEDNGEDNVDSGSDNNGEDNVDTNYIETASWCYKDDDTTPTSTAIGYNTVPMSAIGHNAVQLSSKYSFLIILITSSHDHRHYR